jgi:prepilin-type N-terminal cleavage/methylation domain-containing protein
MMHRNAFSRVELLIVLTILAIISGVAVVSVQKIRNAANRMADT